MPSVYKRAMVSMPDAVISGRSIAALRFAASSGVGVGRYRIANSVF
jgi:hypothetical protein